MWRVLSNATILAGSLMMAASASATTSVGNYITCFSDSPSVRKLNCSSPLERISNEKVEFAGLTTDSRLSILQFDFQSGYLNITSGLYSQRPTFLEEYNFRFGNISSAFTSAILLSTGGVTGFGQSNISIDAGLLTISIANGGAPTAFTRDGVIRIALNNAEVPVSVIPEPATWTMMVGGFWLIGLTARRRRRLAIV